MRDQRDGLVVRAATVAGMSRVGAEQGELDSARRAKEIGRLILQQQGIAP